MTAPQATPSNRRALIILGVGAGLIAVVLLASRLLGGGGSGDSAAPVTVPNRAAGATTTTTTTAPGPAPAETFEVFSTKNPFTPLVDTTGGGGSGGATPTTPPGGGATATTLPGGTSGGGSPTATTAPGGGSSPTTVPGSVEPRPAQRVALLDIYDREDGARVANVRVNDTVYESLAPGDVFAGSYKVVALDDRCGTFLFGDDRFRLCRGEEVLK